MQRTITGLLQVRTAIRRLPYVVGDIGFIAAVSLSM